MKKPAELSGAQPRKPPRGKPFPKGTSGCPGGVSKEQREFVKAFREGHGAETIEALVTLIREGNVPAILKASEWVMGRPPAAGEDNDAAREGLTVVVQKLVGGE